MNLKRIGSVGLWISVWSCGPASDENPTSRRPTSIPNQALAANDGESLENTGDAQANTEKKSLKTPSKKGTPVEESSAKNGQTNQQENLSLALSNTIRDRLSTIQATNPSALNNSQLQGLSAALNNTAQQALGGGSDPTALIQSLLANLGGIGGLGGLGGGGLGGALGGLGGLAGGLGGLGGAGGAGLGNLQGAIGSLLASAQSMDIAGAVTAMTDIMSSILGTLGI